MARTSFLLASAWLAMTTAAWAGGPEPRNPRVLFIVDKECPRCEQELARLRKPGGDFDSMRSLGWKIGDGPDNHLQIVNRDEISRLTPTLKLHEFPAVACIEGDEVVRSFKHGCTTPLDAWTFGFLLKGKDERPKDSVLEPARVKTTGQYPLRGNHWTVDGDPNPPIERVISHLRGPNHGHQVAGRYAIETWSYEELRSLHDDLHEREMGGVTASTAHFQPRDPFQGLGPRKASFK